ncbi:uncharacterized protein [Amphiura filiformis]|uniref:uncharacterized protein n=1 Tax=Amphiura filiformis TaxID=82378 RepID=UPI003B21AE63
MAAGGALGNKSVAKRTKSFDVFIPIEQGTSKHVHLQILQGDITKENINAMAVFRSDTDIAEGDSLRILQAAGDGIEAEYQHAKTRGGKNVKNGVVLTGARDLEHPEHILHLLVKKDDVKLRIALALALRLAEKQCSRSIAFPHLPAVLCSKETVMTMLESFDDFTRVVCPICLHFIQVVLPNDDGFYQYAAARQNVNFDMYRYLLIEEQRSFNRRLQQCMIKFRCGCTLQRNTSKCPTSVSTHIFLSKLSHDFYHAGEIHAKLGQVHLHVHDSSDYNHTHLNVAFVDFCNVTREHQWPAMLTVSCQCQQFSDITATHLADNISIKTVGNQSLFAITIDNEPGKFPRIRSAIHRVLQYADQKGINYIIFPAGFDYGDDQIELPKATSYHWYRPKRYNIFQLLYFNAVYDFALYGQPSIQHSIHIHTTESADSNWTYETICFKGFPSSQGKEAGCFESLFTQLNMDPLFIACHLSVVKETYRVSRSRCKWVWDQCREEFYLHAKKSTNLDRFTYGRALQQIAPIKIPYDVMFSERSTSGGKSSSSDETEGGFREYKDYIDMNSYIRDSSCMRTVVRFDNAPPPPPKPSSALAQRIQLKKKKEKRGFSHLGP